MTTTYRDALQGNAAYCAFEVGQHIVCVDDVFNSSVGQFQTMEIVAGRIYTVDAVGVGKSIVVVEADGSATRTGPEVVMLNLKEVDRLSLRTTGRHIGKGNVRVAADRFRPLPKLSVYDFANVAAPADLEGADA